MGLKSVKATHEILGLIKCYVSKLSFPVHTTPALQKILLFFGPSIRAFSKIFSLTQMTVHKRILSRSGLSLDGSVDKGA